MHVNNSTEVIKSTYRGQDVYVHLKDGIEFIQILKENFMGSNITLGVVYDNTYKENIA